MNSYTDFSEYYDRLMRSDFNYEHIADYLENLFDLFGCNPNLVCELACGTGNITLPLSKRGYDMIAVDKSYEMLDIARKKSDGSILFLNQDMTKLDLYGSVDAVICMIDGINYVLNPNSLFNMFKRIKTCFLEPGGIFIFDISSEYKLKEKIGSNTFVYNGEDIYYSWENRFVRKMSDMYLTFFVRHKNGLYRRFAERHIQRAYREDEIICMLKKAGFTSVQAFDGMTFNPVKADSERIVFAAK